LRHVRGAIRTYCPQTDRKSLPLLVVHTDRHLDHRAADKQFTGLPHVQVVGFDLESVRRYYNFTDWPNGLAQIDLGDRTVDVIPTPDHNETEINWTFHFSPPPRSGSDAKDSIPRFLVCRLVYRMLKYGQQYVDKGMEHYDQRYRDQHIRQVAAETHRHGATQPSSSTRPARFSRSAVWRRTER
jgi:hypothetical protein